MKQDEELDFFGISKESDQTKNEMGLFLGLMVFGSALLFFMLPVLCITLVLTYFLQRKFTLKVEWGLFLIFAVSFGLALFRYGYLPLLQYGVIWKSFFPQFVNFFEKIVQNGTPFQVTNTSYFLGFLLIGTCTNLFLLISRRLKRTWFTKEKEQKKTDYLESDKFKKFFKERHRIIEKEQEKYRQSENKRIYLGMSVEKINEYLDINSLFTHFSCSGYDRLWENNSYLWVIRRWTKKRTRRGFCGWERRYKNRSRIKKISVRLWKRSHCLFRSK